MVSLKQKWIWIVIIIVIFLLFFSFLKKDELSIETKFYDLDKNLVETSHEKFSIIGDIPGFHYVTFTVRVTNTGDQDLWVQITDAAITPSGSEDLYNALDKNVVYSLKPGKFVAFPESNFIDITQFEGTNQRFTIQVTGTYEYPGAIGARLIKEGYVDLTIKPEAF